MNNEFINDFLALIYLDNEISSKYDIKSPKCKIYELCGKKLKKIKKCSTISLDLMLQN